jgi:hypothetical protein
MLVKIATAIAIVAGIVTILTFFLPDKNRPTNQIIENGTGSNIGTVDRSKVDIQIQK